MPARRIEAVRDALAVVLFVLLLRVPFLDQAIQGDDVNYLNAAQYAQINPLHPQHVWFVFQGARVTMQGHPHPPLNAWFLAALLAAGKDIREVPFHAAYILFSLIAGLAALSLARRFTPLPLLATLLFLASPAFVVNGNSLESDLPFLAFWLAAIALFVKAVEERSARWLAASVAVMPFAAMAAFQSVLLTPLLGLYLWRRGRDWRAAWAAVLVVPLALAGWELFEKVTSDTLPAQVLAGYFTKYGLQTLANKGRNAVALTVHLGWVVFPLLALGPAVFLAAVAAGGVLFGWGALMAVPLVAGLAVIAMCAREWRDWLAQWVLLFFAGSLALFFAGSARYLLPLALPVAFLAARRFSARRLWLWLSLGAQLVVGLALATVNYDHWDGYRQVVRRYEGDWKDKRVWVNGELGLRYYAESAGAIPLERGQALRPGDVVLSSQLTAIPFTTGGAALIPIAQVPVTSRLPLRLIGLNARSGYSAAAMGLRAFDVSSKPIDVVRLETVVERKPELSFLPMNAPQADQQIVSGVNQLEQGSYRWMGKRAVLLLKSPPAALPLQVELYVPDQAVGRTLSVAVDGVTLASRTFSAAGKQRMETPPVKGNGETATVAIEVDRLLKVPGDQRELGMILTAVGFRQP